MKDDLRLEGKIAAITGAASGIGKEIAVLFAQHGASIALIDLDRDKMDAVKEEIKGRTEAFCININVESEVKTAFDEIEKKFGKIDILVNCAGIFAAGTVSETDFATWRKVLGVNLDGAFLCSKYAADSMLRTGSEGVIINIASEAGLVALAGQTAYNVSKAALISLSKCMAVDYALKKIRVNCVCPGRVLTQMVQHIVDSSDDPEKTLMELSSDRPVMSMGNPRDIAYACLHFADDSMPYATGAVLAVDGGSTA